MGFCSFFLFQEYGKFWCGLLVCYWIKHNKPLISEVCNICIKRLQEANLFNIHGYYFEGVYLIHICTSRSYYVLGLSGDICSHLLLPSKLVNIEWIYYQNIFSISDVSRIQLLHRVILYLKAKSHRKMWNLKYIVKSKKLTNSSNAINCNKNNTNYCYCWHMLKNNEGGT